MNPKAVIRRKRDGAALDARELGAFVQGTVDGTWSKGQIGAMLMALYQRGMNLGETRMLLEGMLHSGEVLRMDGTGKPVVDKHSTGGVGDKVSLVLAPLAAACGLAVPMLSGRGLGHTGGTLDKLEAIPGFRVFLSADEIRHQVDRVGCCIAGQTDSLVPADKILYAMRDETETVESVALVACSILSKKLAEGLDALFLDVKFGRGAFFKEFDEARELASLMVELGKAAGCRTSAWLTRMDAPLGRAIGNAVEVEECIRMLKGEGPDELADFICQQVAGMLVLTGLQRDHDTALDESRAALSSGKALRCFTDMVAAQDGDTGIISDPAKLPQPSHIDDILYEEPEPAWVGDVDSLAVAGIVLETGAGRRNAEDAVDPSTGISALVSPGDRIQPGDLIGRLHHNDPGRLAEWSDCLRRAVSLTESPVEPPPLIVERIT